MIKALPTFKGDASGNLNFEMGNGVIQALENGEICSENKNLARYELRLMDMLFK